MNTTAFTQWLALSMLPGLSASRLKHLLPLVTANLQGRSSPASVEDVAVAAELAPAVQQQLRDILQGNYSADVRKVSAYCLDWARREQHHILTLSCPGYPPLLKEIAEPPPFLFIAGDPTLLALPQIGIVGSRRPTADGRSNARLFAAQLVTAGYQVTSGLAEGIDAESHAGALKHGNTLAVLGSGLEQIYPKKHVGLAQHIIASGALISEFLPTAAPAPWHFPRRNRIISGLSHGVLVVEAAERSGSLITARLAADQGREVFVLPGSIHNPMARGCHQLIRQGAKLVETVDDILIELPALLAWERATEKAAMAAHAALSAAERSVLACIAYDPASVDVLLQRTRFELPELYACLLQLELKGVISNVAGAYVLSTG